MSQFKLQSSLALALLAMLNAAPAQANDLQLDEIQRLRLAPANTGLGFGSLVMPTTSEQGQLEATLYNDQDRPIYDLAGHLSLFLPDTVLPVDRNQFGGFFGSMRSLQSSIDPHPSFVGFVEGTWSMNGQGSGDLRAIVYQVDGEGEWQAIGVVNGEFDALQLGIPEVEPTGTGSGLSFTAQSAGFMRPWGGGVSEVEDEDEAVRLRRYAHAAASAQRALGANQIGSSMSLASGLSYQYLNVMRQVRNAAQLTSEFQSSAQQLRSMTDIGFAERSDDVEARIQRARRQAAIGQASTSGSSGQGQDLFPADYHMAGHLMIRFSIVN